MFSWPFGPYPNPQEAVVISFPQPSVFQLSAKAILNRGFAAEGFLTPGVKSTCFPQSTNKHAITVAKKPVALCDGLPVGF
jgi:hypothetical protein